MKPKIRYATLDGLRGVAAICVVLHHTNIYRDSAALAPRGALAVDFFLMLSGFVIAKTYQERLHSGLSLASFAKRRLIRLYPVALVGLLFGVFKLVSESALGYEGPNLTQVIIACGLNIFLLPYWAASPFRGEMFPTNPPIWSLFAELGLNFGWAAFEKSNLKRSALLAIVAFSGAASGSCICRNGVETLSYSAVLGPCARIAFAFLLGASLVGRWNVSPRIRGLFVHPLFLSALLSLALLNQATGVVWDILAIYILLPAVLVCGISAGLEREGPIQKFLGDISYPLYAVHFPIFLLISGFLHRFPLNVGVRLAIALGMMISFATAVVISRYLDGPMRSLLSKILIRENPPIGIVAPASIATSAND